LSQDSSGIIKKVKDMENETKELRLDLLRMCWYMRGGVTYSEVSAMSPQEREIIGGLVKQNLETTKKTGQPFF
jgi:hypothetical protein